MVGVARHVSDLSGGPVVVVTNPDEDCSAEAFRAVVDDVLSGPEPELATIGAADALRELRADNDA